MVVHSPDCVLNCCNVIQVHSSAFFGVNITQFNQFNHCKTHFQLHRVANATLAFMKSCPALIYVYNIETATNWWSCLRGRLWLYFWQQGQETTSSLLLKLLSWCFYPTVVCHGV